MSSLPQTSDGETSVGADSTLAWARRERPRILWKPRSWLAARPTMREVTSALHQECEEYKRTFGEDHGLDDGSASTFMPRASPAIVAPPVQASSAKPLQRAAGTESEGNRPAGHLTTLASALREAPVTNLENSSELRRPHRSSGWLLGASQQDRKKQAAVYSKPAPMEADGESETIARHQLYQRQLEKEEDTLNAACEEYQKIIEQLLALGKAATLQPVEKLLITWFEPLVRAIIEEREATHNGDRGEDRKVYGPLLLLLRPEQLAVLTMHTIIGTCLKHGADGAKFSQLVLAIGDAVQAETRVLKLKRQNAMRLKRASEPAKSGAGLKPWQRLGHDPSTILRGSSPRLVNLKARRLLGNEESDWPNETRAKLGGMLLNEFLKICKQSSERPMFEHAKAFRRGKTVGVVQASVELLTLIQDSELMQRAALPRFLPMLVEPVPWRGYDSGGFLRLRAVCMRTHGCRLQADAIRRTDVPDVFAGLDSLSRVPWKINRELFSFIMQCWHAKLELPELPAQDNLVIPPEPEFDDNVDQEQAERLKSQWRRRCAKLKRKNADLHSLRCDLIIKLNIAQQFQDEDRFYFPYNLDFRGRAYPIPPNLNHLGSDICRGMLMFADSKALGERGLFWLRVHLANLFGKSKHSLADRVAFVEQHEHKVLAVADCPLTERWWTEADEPWQALATCRELAAALRHPSGPETYECSLPVHADGSCNGLQHYASLGRDEEGGRQVNLLPGDKPNDVYTGVCNLVAEKVSAAARATLPGEPVLRCSKGTSATKVMTRGDTSRDEKSMSRWAYDDDGGVDEDGACWDEKENEGDHKRDEFLQKLRLAQIVDGMIDRKVVKQTVMTSVYGVTFVGARQQILARLYDKVESIMEAAPSAERDAKISRLRDLGVIDPETGDVDDRSMYQCSRYVAQLTLEVLEELFTSARNIMAWLGQCARLIARDGQPVSWITPLGLPVVQPYRRDSTHAVKTLAQTVVLVENSEQLPVSVSRQKSGFPPNFVHSLDSSHMLLTAIEMERRGLTFTAVHDSYWTHAADVDVMNKALRRCFLDLYSEPVLEQLRESFELRHPHIEFPEVPTRGTLDIRKVIDATYFFS